MFYFWPLQYCCYIYSVFSFQISIAFSFQNFTQNLLCKFYFTQNWFFDRCIFSIFGQIFFPQNRKNRNFFVLVSRTCTGRKEPQCLISSVFIFTFTCTRYSKNQSNLHFCRKSFFWQNFAFSGLWPSSCLFRNKKQYFETFFFRFKDGFAIE